MNKKLLISMMAAGFVILLLASCMPVQAEMSDSFIIYGQTKAGNSPKDGVEVTVTNEDTDEELTTTSATDDFGHKGYYSVNLGNMPTQWNRGDNITVEFKFGTTRSASFTIPDAGTMYELDVSMPSKKAGAEKAFLGSAGIIFILPLIIILLVVVAVAYWLYTSKGKKVNNAGLSKSQAKRKK